MSTGGDKPISVAVIVAVTAVVVVLVVVRLCSNE
jgi:hypothetical protein